MISKTQITSYLTLIICFVALSFKAGIAYEGSPIKEASISHVKFHHLDLFSSVEQEDYILRQATKENKTRESASTLFMDLILLSLAISYFAFYSAKCQTIDFSYCGQKRQILSARAHPPTHFLNPSK